MTKKQLEKRIEELENLVEIQQRLLEMLKPIHEYNFIYSSVNNDDCPMGGKHEFNTHTSGGLMCRCGKTKPHDIPPTTIM